MHPWYKKTIAASLLAYPFSFDVPHSLFSTRAIDAGTTLLLSALGETTPNTVLDLGCGYGALALPVAKAYPNATVTAVDRDLLAVDWTKRNARNHALANVNAKGSVGYAALDDRDRFDWILSNVPARIGERFIEYLFLEGMRYLSDEGEIRVVVINDLAPLVRSITERSGVAIEPVAEGKNHRVYRAKKTAVPYAPSDLYYRDMVAFRGIHYARPVDFGGDDAKRLTYALPLLADILETYAPENALIVSAGYGALALFLASTRNAPMITAVERDLLGTAFIERNRQSMGIARERLRVIETAYPSDAIEKENAFDLIAGEIPSAFGVTAAVCEIATLTARGVKKGGDALFVTLEKNASALRGAYCAKTNGALEPLAFRNGYALMRATV